MTSKKKVLKQTLDVNLLWLEVHSFLSQSLQWDMPIKKFWFQKLEFLEEVIWKFIHKKYPIKTPVFPKLLLQGTGYSFSDLDKYHKEAFLLQYKPFHQSYVAFGVAFWMLGSTSVPSSSCEDFVVRNFRG